MLRRVILAAGTGLALTGTALAQTNPWVSLAKGDLAGCQDTLKEFQARWLSSLAHDRDDACAGSEKDTCTLLRNWHDEWKALSPADFMMIAPADCEDCTDEKMIDEFIDPAFRPAVPVIVVKAASPTPAIPAKKGDHLDGFAYMPVAYHCLSGLWVEKLFRSGQTLAGVKITAQEGQYLKVTPQAFDGMVSSLTQKYAVPAAAVAGLDGAPKPVPAAPKPVPPKPPKPVVDAVRVAVRDCGDSALASAKRIKACTAAIDGHVEGAELVLAYWARSVLRLDEGDVDGAIDDADIAGDLYGQDYSVQNARCWSRAVAAVELDVARQACTLAIRLAPEEASVHDSRGLVGLQQKRWNDAWNDYAEAVYLAPDFASALFGRGLAAAGLGMPDEAADDFEAALDLDPDIGDEYAAYGLTPEAIAATAPDSPQRTAGGHLGRAKTGRKQQ